MNKLHGVLVPSITPFKKNSEIDYEAIKSHVDFLISNGVHGIIPAGSTGEHAMLTLEEKKCIFKTFVDAANGKVKIIPGTHTLRNEESKALTKYAKDIGADAVMATVPYYFPPSDEEIWDYFSAIASVGLPVVIYNFPGNTKIDMSSEFLVKMSQEIPNIDYVKNSGGDVRRIHELIMLSEDKIGVFEGFDDLGLEAFVTGAHGWIDGSANIVPQQCVKLYELAVEQKDFNKAKSHYYEFLPLFSHLINCGKFVATVKAGVELEGGPSGSPRKPLLSITQSEKDQLKKILEQLKVI